MLKSNPSTIPLGTLRIGSSNSFKYKITNDSDKPVKINTIQVGCGSCTTAYADAQSIPAGETTELNVNFKPNSTGMQVKTVRIFYDGGSLEVKFSATVI